MTIPIVPSVPCETFRGPTAEPAKVHFSNGGAAFLPCLADDFVDSLEKPFGVQYSRRNTTLSLLGPGARSTLD